MYEPLTRPDVPLIRAALYELAHAAETVTHLSLGRLALEGSAAAAQIAEASTPPKDASNAVRSAHNGLLYTNLAAVDHMLAFVDLAQRGRSSVAAATVTRGALESLAKSHYLLTASDSSALLARHLALREFETTHSARTAASASTRPKP